MSVQRSVAASVKSYVIGFVLSIIATLIPFYLVINKMISGMSAITIIFAFAFLQFIIQLFFFMHIVDDSKPKWNSISLVYTLLAAIIFVVLSWWIMHSLDHFAMSGM